MTTPRSSPVPWRRLGLVTVMLVAVAGCPDKGVQRVTINGTVTYKGQPVTSGILRFIGQERTASSAAIRPDGTFIITDVVPGEVKVGITERPQSSGSSSGAPSPEPKAPPISLPDKYRDPERSGVTYTITAETKELNIDLK